MVKNLNDFINSNQNIHTEQKNNTTTSQNVEQAEQQAKDIVNKYKGLNKNQLMQEFVKEVTKQKKEGTFDKNKLLNMLNSVKSLLPRDMYNQALDILDSI